MEMSGNQMYENLKKIVRKRGRILKDVCKEIDINENTLKSGITNKTNPGGSTSYKRCRKTQGCRKNI